MRCICSIKGSRNCAFSGFSAGLDRTGIEEKLQELCLKNLNDLSSFDLIKMEDKLYFKPTETGRLMAWHYIAFDTMKKCFMINGTETLSELVKLISSCNEFSDIKLRTNEKRILNTLNKDKNKITIRYPMEGKIKTREMKVNCLIQAQLGCIPIQDFTLTQDIGKIFRNGIRVTKWLSEFLASRQGNFLGLLNALILAKCFKCRLWENSLYVSKQLEKIGLTLSNAMVNAGLTSFKKIEDTNARELELILNRHPPFGNQIKESIMYLPKYELTIEQLAKYGEVIAEILVTIILTNFKQLQTKRTAPDSHYVTLIIGNDDNQVVLKQKILDSALLKIGKWAKKVEVRRPVKSDELSINLISSEYVGLDIQQKFEVFYLGPKEFGNQMLSRRRKLESAHYSDSCQTSQGKSPAERISKGGVCSQESFSRKHGNRTCNHHCKNKDICGHDCCKFGVSQKSDMKKDTAFSSYLADLRNRSAESAVPPVKKLKMQLLNKSQKVDLEQFCYTPRSFLPGLSRQDCGQHSGFAVLKTTNDADVLQRCLQDPEVCRQDGSFVSNPSAALNEKNHWTVISNSLKESLMNNLTDADKSSALFSEPLNVNFELGNEIWSDYDDESLIHVSTLIADTEKAKQSESSHSGSLNRCQQNSEVFPPGLGKANSYFENIQSNPAATHFKSFFIFKENSDICVRNSSSPSLTPPANVKSLAEYGCKSIFGFQEKNSPTQKLKSTQIAATSETILQSSQITGKEDFFICNKRIAKEGDLRYQLSDDDIKPFLGIFDGIF